MSASKTQGFVSSSFWPHQDEIIGADFLEAECRVWSANFDGQVIGFLTQLTLQA